MKGERFMRKWGSRLPLFQLYVIGFLIAIISVAFLGQAPSVISRERLVSVQGALGDGSGMAGMAEGVTERGTSKLLPYVAYCRGRVVLFLIVAGTTYLAPVVCGASAVWIGYCFGRLLVTLLLQLGMQGLLTCIAILFPQWLFYAPAFTLLFRWCESLYGGIYVRKKLSRGECMAKLILLLAMFCAGILLESSVGFWLFKFRNV